MLFKLAYVLGGNIEIKNILLNVLVRISDKNFILNYWAGKLSRNLLSNVSGGITSNLLNGKPVFKNLTYLQFGNGIITLGEGNKILNPGKATSQLGNLGKSLIANRLPDFDLYNLSFDYGAPKAIFKYKMSDWSKTTSKEEKIIRIATGIGFAGILSTLGLSVR
jgi:hypothetical protein